MYFLIAGTIIFFGLHLYSSFRSRISGLDIRERLGYMNFMGLYSLVSGLGFALMIWGYGLARSSTQIFTPPDWGVTITMALMLPAFILLMAAYGPHGNIKQFVKHPMLIAVFLWSFGHLLANGEANSLILFGSFLIYVIIDRIAVSGRPSSITHATIAGDLYAVIIGSVLYYLFIKYLHSMMIGVDIISTTAP